MSEKLTPKQEAAARAHVEGADKSDAYRSAYDTSGMKPETVNRAAFELFENPKMAARVEELRDAHMKRHNVTVDRVLAEYAKLAFLDIRKAFDADGNLIPIHQLDDATAAAICGLEVDKKVSKLTDENGEPMVESHLHKIKLSDKKGALDSLAKTLGMFSDGSVNVNVNTQPLPEQDKALLAEYAKAD